ncbi:ATP-dependent serine peptidase containing a PDZ domain protein, partial [Schumannella luteola]
MTTGADRGPDSRRQLVGQGLLIVAILAALLLAISPAPYVVERPGPVYDTLGTTEVDGEEVPVLQVDGAESYPTDGRLDLLTVYLDGSHENPLDWFDVVGAWLDPRRAIVPIDAVYPAGQT